MSSGLEQKISELNHKIRLVTSRVETFRDLKEAYSRGEYSTKSGFEANDFIGLKCNEIQNYWKDMEIPQDLVDEADWILDETRQLGYSIDTAPCEEYKKQNQERFVEYFRRCETVERRLLKIVSDYKEKNTKSES
jgi:hypothetical protein